MELAPHGINVNAVAPGTTNTPMHTGLWEAAVAYLQSSIPLGRLAEPEDIADVVLFLVTNAARYITGQTIHVNGGQIMVD
jgi:3-oxoacyl-[acyl-carrier protein] reductase